MVEPVQTMFPRSEGVPAGGAIALSSLGHESHVSTYHSPAQSSVLPSSQAEQGADHGLVPDVPHARPIAGPAPASVPDRVYSQEHYNAGPSENFTAPLPSAPVLSGGGHPSAPSVPAVPASPPDYQQEGDFIVPAILIHAFCEGQGLVDLIRTAQGDRRFRRSTVMMQMGGMQASLERYQHESTPDLVLVETDMVGPDLFARLDALASICDQRTRVVLIGVSNDVALYRELMRRGVSEYLVQPLEPLQLVRSIAQLYKDPDQAFLGRSIAFLGSRGGVGASTFSHNVGWFLAETAGLNTLLVDFDLAWGTAGLNLNQDNKFGLAEAIMDTENLDQTMMERLVSRKTERLALLSAPASLDRNWQVRPDMAERIITMARSLASYVLLDMPHVWSDWMHGTLIDVDQIVLVATPDLASLRNTKNILDLLHGERKNEVPPFVVLNQVNMPRRPEITVKDFGAALNVHPGLIIPFDSHLFGEAANNGQMLADINPKSPVVTVINQFASTLVGRGSAEGTKKESLFNKILKRK